MLTIVFNLLLFLVRAYCWALIASAVISMLLAFNVLDSRNRFVWSIADFLARVTDPVLRPLRRVVPVMGGIDFTPWVALVLLQLVVAPLLIRIYDALAGGDVRPLLL